MEAVRGWVWIFSGIAQYLFPPTVFIYKGTLVKSVTLDILANSHFILKIWLLLLFFFLIGSC